MELISKLLTAGAGRQLRKYEELAAEVSALEPSMQARSDADLRYLTTLFRERYARGEPLDALLPEAFAAVREASARTTGLRHFDVQLVGGMALHDGKIAEMATGEGKTLVSVLAGYLNAIPGEGVHVVTANDYLAQRDSSWMAPVYRALGMRVGLVQNGTHLDARQLAYRADVTYSTYSELAFDYLRDNMVLSSAQRAQRGHRFAIVDEADCILIDGARTPLAISGPVRQNADACRSFADAVTQLEDGDDFELDEGKKTIVPTEAGLAKIERILGIDNIYGDATGRLPSHLQQALRAQFLYHRDVDYVVIGGQVKIIDALTGRIMEGRRYSGGLHQAIEAKEGLDVGAEEQTIASITLQNYFRLYEKISGMTGTAATEEVDFREIYGMPVVAIPPNRPTIRDDGDDLVYRTAGAKYAAVANEVAERHLKGQPVLVGTVSVENSERLSALLEDRGIPHEVLNAKNHGREAAIIAQAGRLGAVTISTNMAGRGVDILLGGNPAALSLDLLLAEGLDPLAAEHDAEGNPNPAYADEPSRKAALSRAEDVCRLEQVRVLEAGGLCVIGTERHESRRIDNQLRGRAGRQGDPGSSRFYLSLEDDLIRRFAGEEKLSAVSKTLERTGVPDDVPVRGGMVSKTIEAAQQQVENLHCSARKHVLQYDDVMDAQRKAVYAERNAILDGKNVLEKVPEIARDAVRRVVGENCKGHDSTRWNTKAVDTWMAAMTGRATFKVGDIEHDDNPDDLTEAICEIMLKTILDKIERYGAQPVANLASQVMLRVLDLRWVSHLHDMDHLKTGIGLRAIGRRDPLLEYKGEAYEAFERMTEGAYEDFLSLMLRAEVASDASGTAARHAQPA